jgi:hypothetical protein
MAAADRIVDGMLETVTPELVLIDPALRANARRSLGTPEDTLARLGRLLAESRSARPAAEGETTEADVERRPRSVPPAVAGFSLAPELERGVEDLIVIPAEELAPHEGTSRHPVAPASPPADPYEVDGSEELPLPHAKNGIDDLIVLPADEKTRDEGRRRGNPMLPTLPPTGLEEDATYFALRRISEHFEVEPPKKRTHRALSIMSVVAAVSSVAILSVDLRLGLAELPSWLPL